MDIGSVILLAVIALVVVALIAYVIARSRRSGMRDIEAEQVPELLRAERQRFSGYPRPGGPEAR